MLDVIGQNYREGELLNAYREKPERKIIGTETAHDPRAWLVMRDNPAFSGQFLWTGFDYLGEGRAWPEFSMENGLFDRSGRASPRAFERQSWWSDAPMVYMTRRVEAAGATTPRQTRLLTDWTPPEQTTHEENVEVYSNCDEVELLLNEKSLGSQPRPQDASARKWKVTYEPGTLKAVGKKEGKVVATHELRTAGPPAKIALTADRMKLTANWDDVSYLTATIVDKEGVPVPDASDPVEFKVTGPGVVAAVDNGDRFSIEPFQATNRHAYRGQCIAIIKATGRAGPIEVTASAAGLAASSVTIETAAKAGGK